MKLTKRIIALMISVLMIATLLPAGVFAIDVADSETVAAGVTDNSSGGFHVHMDFEGVATTLEDYLDEKLAASELVDRGSGDFSAATEEGNTYLQTAYAGTGLYLTNAEKLTGQPIKISFDFRVNENEKMVTSTVYFPIVRFSASTATGGTNAPLSNPLMLEIPTNRAEKSADAYGNTYMGILGYSTAAGATSGSFVDGMKVYSNVWYSVELTYDPNTTLGQVHVKDAYGATCVFGVDCAYQSVINLVTFFRAQGDKYSPICDFDNLVVSSASAVDVMEAMPGVGMDVAATFNALAGGAVADSSSFAELSGFTASGTFSGWSVVDDGTGNKFLQKKAGNAYPVTLKTSSGILQKGKVELSFDWYACGDYNNSGVLSVATSASSDNRLLAVMSSKLVLGKAMETIKVLSSLPTASDPKWINITVVIDTATADYEIYVDGVLKVVTVKNPATGKHKVWSAENGGWMTSEFAAAAAGANGYPAFGATAITGFYFFHYYGGTGSKAATGIDNIRIRTFDNQSPTYINNGVMYDIPSLDGVCCKDAYLNGGAALKVVNDSPVELSLNGNGYNHFENDAVTIEGTVNLTAGSASEPLVVAALNRYYAHESVITTPLMSVDTTGSVSVGAISGLTSVTLGENTPFKLTVSGISAMATLEIGGKIYSGIPLADHILSTAGSVSHPTGNTVTSNSSATIKEYTYYVGMNTHDTLTLMDGEGWTSSLTGLKVYVDKNADWYNIDFDSLVGYDRVPSEDGKKWESFATGGTVFPFANDGDRYAVCQSTASGSLRMFDLQSSLVGKTFVFQADYNFFYGGDTPSDDNITVASSTIPAETKVPGVCWDGNALFMIGGDGKLYLPDGTTELNATLSSKTWHTLAVALHPGPLTESGYLYNYDVFIEEGDSLTLLGSSSVTIPVDADTFLVCSQTDMWINAVDGSTRFTMGYDNIRIYGAAAPDGADLALDEDDISLDLTKTDLDFSYDLFGTAAIADRVLTTGEAGGFVWHDLVSLANNNLQKTGFTVEMKIKAAAPTAGTRVLLQLAADDISRNLLTIDAEGKIVISGSTGKYPVASLDATEYTAIQLAFVRDTEMIGVYADGKLLGNVSYKTDLLLSELFALHFAEDVALSEFKVHSTLVRDYVDESGTIVEWDAEYYTDSGSNLSDGASVGDVANDGVMTAGNFTRKTSNGETFFRRNVKNTDQTELFVTGSFTGEVAQIDVTFRNTPPAEGATTASQIIRLRKATDSDTYHLFLLSMEDSTGYIYLDNGSALYLCDEEGNRYSANTDWISVSIVYNAKMATARYAVNGELAYYVKASGDGFTEPLKANALPMNGSFSVHQSDAVEMRIRYYPGGSANTVDISHIRAYKIADQNGISTAQTFGAQVGTVKLDASGNITANADEVVEEVNAVRFLAGVDTTLYTGIGFDFEMWDDTAKAWKDTKTVNSPVVYTSVSAAGETVTARELGYRYIVAAAIIGVDSTAYIRVRPYANLGAGAKMYGDADVYLVTYDNGSVSVSKPIEGYAVYSESFEERNMSNYLRYNYSGNPITADVLNNNVYGFTTGGDYSAAATRVERGDGYGGSSAMSILDAHRADNGGFSGRVKLMQILPDDLSAYEGATLRLSLKIKGSDFVTSQITEVDGVKEEVYTEATSAKGACGFMLADGYTSWGGKTYTLTQEGEWITVTTELTLTSTHLKTLQDGTTYDPICVYVQFGSSPYARDTFIDDVVVELIAKDCELLK